MSNDRQPLSYEYWKKGLDCVLKFGIDIDGTVTCPKSLIPFINEGFNLNITLDDLTEYEITECLNIPEDTFAKWFIETEPKIYAGSPPALGVKPVLDHWYIHHKLIYISARNPSLMDVTKKWFIDHEINYHHIELVGSHDKVSTAKKFEIDLFFEDKHDNAVAITEELGIPVVLFDTPYNRKPSPDTVIRVYNWNEAKNWVNNWVQNKKKIQNTR